MLRRVGLTFALLTMAFVSVAKAVPTVVLGNYSIPTGTASTAIPINITGGDALTGMTLVLEISQGGVFPSTGGPNFTSLNATTGTIWGNAGTLDTQGVTFSNRTGNTTITNANPPNGGPATWTPSVTPAVKTKDSFLQLTGSPVANGLLATITVSTLGVAPGVYDFHITPPNVTANGGGSTTFLGAGGALTSALTNGTITVTAVPEPTTLVLGLFAAAGLGAVAIRNRRARKTA